MEKIELLEKIGTNVIQGRKEKDDEGFDEGFEGQLAIKELVTEAIHKKIEFNVIIDTITEAMKEVGKKFESKEYFLPDMLASAESVALGMKILEPYLAKKGIEKKGKVVMATVKGDIHDIGKNIVSTFLKGGGFEVLDLGTDVAAEDILKSVKENPPQIVGLSALLTSTMGEMKKVIEALRAGGDRIKIMVGGAPLSEDYAREIGADGYAPDAFEAQKLAEELLKS